MSLATYLVRADKLPHRMEGERVLLEHVPQDVRRVLDLSTGDGRLLAMPQAGHPEMHGVGLDFSEVMLNAARERFAEQERVELVRHDPHSHCPSSGDSMPSSRRSPSTISSTRASARSTARSSTCWHPAACSRNFEHVAAPTHRLHLAFFQAIGEPIENEDPSDRLLDVHTQLQ